MSQVAKAAAEQAAKLKAVTKAAQLAANMKAKLRAFQLEAAKLEAARKVAAAQAKADVEARAIAEDLMDPNVFKALYGRPAEDEAELKLGTPRKQKAPNSAGGVEGPLREHAPSTPKIRSTN